MKKCIFISMLLSFLLLAGCSEKDRELVLGTYTNEDSVIFEEDKAITETKKIDDFKEIITNTTETTDRIEDLPDHVVVINNHKESTMELWTNIWMQTDGSVVFSRGAGSQEFFVIDAAEAGQIVDLVEK